MSVGVGQDEPRAPILPLLFEEPEPEPEPEQRPAAAAAAPAGGSSGAPVAARALQAQARLQARLFRRREARSSDTDPRLKLQPRSARAECWGLVLRSGHCSARSAAALRSTCRCLAFTAAEELCEATSGFAVYGALLRGASTAASRSASRAESSGSVGAHAWLGRRLRDHGYAVWDDFVPAGLAAAVRRCVLADAVSVALLPPAGRLVARLSESACVAGWWAAGRRRGQAVAAAGLEHAAALRLARRHHRLAQPR